jgi:hypothetical protein
MAQAMASFAPVGSALSDMEAFYTRAAEISVGNAGRANDGRKRAFLGFISVQASTLAEAIAQHRGSRQDSILHVWLQATPDAPLPGEAELWQLEAAGTDAMQASMILFEASARWAEHHRQLAQLSRTAEAVELHQSLRALLEAWCKRINSAWIQLQDL